MSFLVERAGLATARPTGVGLSVGHLRVAGDGMLDQRDLERKLRIRHSQQVAVVNAARASALIVPSARSLEPHHADVVIGFVRRRAELARLRSVYAAARAGRLAWISYPKPGRPGTDLQPEWLVRALHQYGVEAVEYVSINATWSGLRLRPAPGRTRSKRTQE